MYTGDLFTKARAYVEREHDDWFILSALYNALTPGKEIDPYEYTLIGKSRDELIKWSEQVSAYIAENYETDTLIFIYAGRDYRKFLQPILEGLGYKIEVPMAGLGIGQQKAWLKGRLEA